MDSDMGSDVVSLDSGCLAVAPLAGQIQIVGTLPTDMALADVFLHPKLVSSRH